ncbi:MAG: hypothetical protein FWE35_16325 [Streptosporangiales bacterium]|nr:hypothetical protein [Streptosporangiales bacterium]
MRLFPGEPPSEQRFRAASGRRAGIVAWWRRAIRFLASSRLRRSQYAGIPR